MPSLNDDLADIGTLDNEDAKRAARAEHAAYIKAHLRPAGS